MPYDGIDLWIFEILSKFTQNFDVLKVTINDN